MAPATSPAAISVPGLKRPAIPSKSEALWAQLGLAGKPGEMRGDAAAPAYGKPVAGEATLAPVEILFPRIELKDEAQA